MMQRLVIINCFDTYEHRVKLLKDYFVESGMDVHVITSDWQHFHKTTRTEFPEGFESVHAKPYYKNFSIDRLLSHHLFAEDALQRAEQYSPDILWVLVPPNSMAKKAAAYKRKHKDVKLILDFIDMWPETMPISRFKSLPPFSNWRDLRDRYVSAADVVVTECDLYKTLLEKHYDLQKAYTLYLARKEAPYYSEPKLPEDRISLCYLGSINNIIDIPCIEQIVRNIGQPVDLHIVGDGEKRQKLIEAAASAGANVIFHGKIYDPAEKQKLFDQCHFGLNIMKDSVFVGLTMKSMDYFECGLPIINNIRGDTWKLVESEHIGVNISKDRCISKGDIEMAQRNRSNVRKLFLKHFTVNVFNKQVREILNQLNVSR